MNGSRAIARTIVVVLIIISTVLVASGTYVAWLYETSQPPFCSGYPPGGNCLGNYSYSFRISVNYSGSWRASYYGFHRVGAPSSPFNGVGNYTGGSYGGTGASERSITLSGPDTNGLTICVQAEKLDSSNHTLTLGIDAMANSTSVSSGSTRLCEGVVP